MSEDPLTYVFEQVESGLSNVACATASRWPCWCPGPSGRRCRRHWPCWTSPHDGVTSSLVSTRASVLSMVDLQQRKPSRSHGTASFCWKYLSPDCLHKQSVHGLLPGHVHGPADRGSYPLTPIRGVLLPAQRRVSSDVQGPKTRSPPRSPHRRWPTAGCPSACL